MGKEQCTTNTTVKSENDTNQYKTQNEGTCAVYVY